MGLGLWVRVYVVRCGAVWMRGVVSGESMGLFYFCHFFFLVFAGLLLCFCFVFSVSLFLCFPESSFLCLFLSVHSSRSVCCSFLLHFPTLSPISEHAKAPRKNI